MEEKNIRKYYLRYILYYFGNTLITGGIIQSFMLESGISSAQVSVYTAVIQFVQAGAMLLLGPVLERKKNIIQINAEAGLGLLPVFAAMLAVCFFPGMDTALKYGLIMGASILAYLAFAVIGILEYKLPYRIIHMENYGRVLSVAGITIGISSLVCSSLLSFFISRYDYFKVMAVFLIVGVLLEFAALRVGESYRDLEEEETEKKEEKRTGTEGTESAEREPGKEMLSIFSYGPFRKLFLPNLLRGVASGTFALLTTVGYYYGIVNASVAGIMTVVLNVVIMAGCMLYARISRKKIDGALVLWSSVALLFLLPGMLVGKSTVVFVCLYGLAALFKNFIDYGCPVICADIVDYEHVGQFSAWRIALYMAGAALAGLVTVPMLDRLGGIPTLAVNGILFLITGIGYYRISQK